MNEWVIINNAFSLFSLNHVHVLFSVYQSSVFMSHLVLCIHVHPCLCPVFFCSFVSTCISMFMSCVMLLLCCVCLHIYVHVFVCCFCGGVSTSCIIPLFMSCVVFLWCCWYLFTSAHVLCGEFVVLCSLVNQVHVLFVIFWCFVYMYILFLS